MKAMLRGKVTIFKDAATAFHVELSIGNVNGVEQVYIDVPAEHRNRIPADGDAGYEHVFANANEARSRYDEFIQANPEYIAVPKPGDSKKSKEPRMQ